MPKLASIGKSVHIKGELSGNEDLSIDGRVEGKITLNGCSVTIGQTGRVEAEIQAKAVVVAGLVHGNVSATDRVEVAATGTLVGDAFAPRVVLVDGARFKGSIDMDAKAGASAAAPAAGWTAGGPAVSRDPMPSYAGATKS